MAVETPPQPGQLPSTPVVGNGARQTNHRTARLVAIVAGLLGAALALATPLPARQADHRPAELAAERRAAKRRRAADRLRGHRSEHQHPVLGGRRPGRTAERGQDGAAVDGAQAGARRPSTAACSSSASTTTLLVIVRNTPVVTAPLSQVLSPACQRLTFTAHADKVTGEFVGLDQGTRRRRSRRTRFAASAAATTSGPRSSASSPTWPAPRRPGLQLLGHRRLALQHLPDAAEDDRDDRRRRA